MNETHHETTQSGSQPEAERSAELEPKPSPAIYVASLADYNNGRIHGQWIDAAREPDEIYADINAILASSREPNAEEWAIHDYEQFGRWRVGEYESIEQVSQVARGIAEHGYAYSAWADVFDGEEASFDFDSFREAYLGHYESATEYVEQMADDLGYEQELDKLPEHLRTYARIDYAAIANDMHSAGEIATVHDPNGGMWIFRVDMLKPAPQRQTAESSRIAIIRYEIDEFCVMKLRICIDINQCILVQLFMQGDAILMTPEQTVKLINLLASKRSELSLSVNEVARQANVDPGTVWRIEQGMIAKPRMESLVAIARVLDINTVDLFTTVGWLTGDDLPSLGTYLRAKFGDLSDAAITDIRHYVHRTQYVYSLADSHAGTASAAARLSGPRKVPPHLKPPTHPKKES